MIVFIPVLQWVGKSLKPWITFLTKEWQLKKVWGLELFFSPDSDSGEQFKDLNDFSHQRVFYWQHFVCFGEHIAPLPKSDTGDKFKDWDGISHQRVTVETIHSCFSLLLLIISFLLGGKISDTWWSHCHIRAVVIMSHCDIGALVILWYLCCCDLLIL